MDSLTITNLANLSLFLVRSPLKRKCLRATFSESSKPPTEDTAS